MWIIGAAIIKAWDVSRAECRIAALIFGYMLTGVYYFKTTVIVGNLDGATS
jgi:hypothetical protein